VTFRALAAAVLLLASAGPAQGQGAREQELESLRVAIDQRKQRIEAFESEQKGLLDALEAVDRAVAAAMEIAAHREREAAEAEAASLVLEAQLPDLEARLERTRAAMSARLVALYKTGELGPAQLVFASQSLRELLDRVDVLGKLLAHDRLLYARFRAEQQALDTARADAVAASQRRDEARSQLGERRADAEQERAAKQTLLAVVRSDRARERAALDELQAAARALEEKIAALGSEEAPAPAAPAVPFATLRGQLVAPVEAEVLRRFGREVDAEFHTQVFHKGIDFGAALGAPVRAVAAGNVRFAGWFRGYGRMVILDHGDRFYSVSGHLDALRVEAGQVVAAGEVIGTVGDTGSLSGPRLYFEIREGSQAVDPLPWLVPGTARAKRSPDPRNHSADSGSGASAVAH
jgi:septal ring factor EnvC (AmiA/AmiB activator)